VQLDVHRVSSSLLTVNKDDGSLRHAVTSLDDVWQPPTDCFRSVIQKYDFTITRFQRMFTRPQARARQAGNCGE